MKRTVLFIFLLTISSPCHADRNTGIRAMALANGALMSSPPLPNLSAHPNEWNFGIKGATFKGELEKVNDRNKEIDFKGQGGAMLISRQMGPSLGWYFMAMGNQTTGDFTVSTSGSPEYDISMSDVKSSLFMGSMGLSYTVMKRTMLPLQIFGGPGLSQTKVSQTVTTTHPSSPDDFDMEFSASTPILMAGAQLGLRLFSWLTINPYYVMTQFTNAKDRCQTYDRPKVRQTGTLYDFSDPNCQDGKDSSTSKIEYDTAFSAYGINILFPGWGLSFNISAEFEGPKNFDGVEFTMATLSLTL